MAVIARPLGIQTNNYAEYMGVILALEKAQALGAREVELVLDSKLVVEQLSGRWKVKHPAIKPLVDRAHRILSEFDRWSIRHEPRANNRAADAWPTWRSTIQSRHGRPRPTARSNRRLVPAVVSRRALERLAHERTRGGPDSGDGRETAVVRWKTLVLAECSSVSLTAE